jgi:HAD superfamily hydrolase (TIGR01509 family)
MSSRAPADAERTREEPPRIPDAVVFDCDGTLADTERLAHRAWSTVLGRYGHVLTDRDLHAVTGLTFPRVHAYFSGFVRLPDADALGPEFSAVLFRLLDTDACAFDDALAVVRALSARGVPLAVASSSSRERLDRTLRVLGIGHVFAASVAGDEVTEGKPAPEPFLRAAELLGTDPLSCTAVEDSVPGVVAAVAAGMRVIAVCRQPFQRARLSAAHLVVTRLEPAHVGLDSPAC